MNNIIVYECEWACVPKKNGTQIVKSARIWLIFVPFRAIFFKLNEFQFWDRISTAFIEIHWNSRGFFCNFYSNLVKSSITSMTSLTTSMISGSIFLFSWKFRLRRAIACTCGRFCVPDFDFFCVPFRAILKKWQKWHRQPTHVIIDFIDIKLHFIDIKLHNGFFLNQKFKFFVFRVSIWNQIKKREPS